MITLIEVRTLQGTLLSLPLGDASNGVSVKDVGGLDPVKATIVSSQSSRRENRNITMKLGIEPDYISASVRGIRSMLYGFFMPESSVSLRFYDSDGLTVDISGKVESFEAPLFSSEPTADISILCFDSDFVDINAVDLSGSTVSTTAETLVEYDGSIETGFVFALNADRVVSSFAIYNRPPDNALRTLDFEADLQAGDTLEISTVSGSKSITLTRSGVRSSYLYGKTAQSDWIDLFPGDNYMRVYAEGNPVPYTITYAPRYGGL